MKSLNIKFNLFFELIIFFQLFLLAKFQVTVRTLPFKYPTLLTLENNELILINENGIHFYDFKLENEYNDKVIQFDSVISDEENKKTTMAQFTPENGGYILIIAKDILYVLEANGNPIHSLSITDYFTSTNYYIIPYKKDEGNYLHYIISYNEGKTIKLNYFKFNLNSPFSNEKLNTINITVENANEIFGLNCIFMTPLTSSNINYDILTCFYNYVKMIYTSSFDPKNNFEKLDSFDYSKEVTSVSFVNYIGGIANNLKTKALVYMIGGESGKPLWMTFDFQNLFSEEETGSLSEALSNEPFLNKIKYFKQSNQFITLSKNFDCHIYFMIYDNDFNAIGRKIFTVESCYNSKSFDIFFNGDNYTIVLDNQDGNVLIQEIIDIEILKVDIKTNAFKGDETSSYSIRVINEVTENQNSEENVSFNIKCKKSTVESSEYNLCTECNNEQGYFEVDINLHGFKECYNNDTKPLNLYLDSDKKYKPCFETCLTCEKGGDEFINNCILCDYKYIKRPESIGTTNCVLECPFGYYFTIYGQYKCREDNQCPEEAKLYIKELKKCTDNCKNENNIYQYQYNGECFEECPSDTSPNADNICIDSNPEKCSKSETEIELREFLTTDGVDFNAKNYAIEFKYTNKHISLYYNEVYSIILYKDSYCIKELSINMPTIDFGNCYLKVKNSIAYTTDKNLIIAIVKRASTNGKSTTSYFFYDPETGDKLDSNTLCAEDTVIMKEDVKSQLKNTNKDMNSILYLIGQNIDVFNTSDEFYTDICFHYESPNGKDIALKDRIQIFYPNITFCEDGCTFRGVDLASMESICDCKFNDLINHELIGDNALISGITGEISDFLSNINLDILQCYEDVFRKKYVLKNVGGFIIIVITFIEIIFGIIYLAVDKINIIKYIYNLSEFYIIFLNDNKYNSNKINFPPKKQNNKKNNKKMNIEENYSNNAISTQKGENFINNKTKNQSISSSKNILKSEKSPENKKEKKNKYKDIDIDFNEYLKTDYDDLDFDSAIKLDQRSFCEYYSDKLIEKQILVDTFYNKDNLRPRSIKILLFLLNINLYFVINGLFFNEEYISELFFSNEEETFFSYFPRSIGRFFYATLVGVIIGFIMDCIFVEEKKVKKIFLREKENTLHLRYEISIIAKQIKKRYIAFIVICFFISIISWYYLSCFNNVYPGVRNEWIKSSITIILIMQILPIIFGLLETIIRALSFKCKSEKIYKLKQYFS